MVPLRTGPPPPAINRYLLPNEEIIVAVRQHPALLLPPLASAIGALLAAIAVGGTPQIARSVQAIVWVLAATLSLRMLMILHDWLIRLIVVTDKRFLLLAGLFTRSVQTISFPNLTDMTFERTPAGRLMGFGSFIIQSDASAHAVINYMPYPEQIYLEIFGTLYPEPPARRPADPADEPSEPPSSGLGWPGRAD
jgi:membrane protein YdbS with pleckstrin-like domain